MKAWVNDVNTTSLRILTSLVIALAGTLAVLWAVLFRSWYPTAEQTKILTGLATFVLTMMGFDVLQFVGKRWTNVDYATAKNPAPASAVTVGGPSSVTVDASGGEASTDTRDGKEGGAAGANVAALPPGRPAVTISPVSAPPGQGEAPTGQPGAPSTTQVRP